MSLTRVGHILVVLSGKGGVGKSSVTTQLALSLCLAGYSVGVLDVDLTGPSMPRMLGVEESRVRQQADGWVPVTVHEANVEPGVGPLRLMSLGLLLGSRGDAVVWRGPKKTAMVRQFLGEVGWGTVDFLVIDTPPGTGDEHIALAETLLSDSGVGAAGLKARAVVVTTPQAVATADVRKELNFCAKVGLPVVGVVENMSGYVCAHCAECSDMFGSGGGRAVAEEFAVPLLGSVPVDPQFGLLIETGRVPVYSASIGASVPPQPQASETSALVVKYRDCSLATEFRHITDRILQELGIQPSKPCQKPSTQRCSVVP